VPSAPTPDIPVSPLDPLYIPFTTADPDGSEITIDDFPQKEAIQYRNIIEKLRVHLLAGDVLTPQAYAFMQTENNDVEAEAWTFTDVPAPTDNGTAAGTPGIINVIWNAPTDEGQGGTIDSYEVSIFEEFDSGVTIVTQRTEGDFTLNRSIFGLTAGAHTVMVAAINEKGVSSNVLTITGIVST